MKVKISHYRWIAAIIIILLFIYMVLLEDVLTVSMPLEWLEQHRHESAEMRYMDSIYTMKEMASAVFHQVSTLSGGPIHNVYAWDSLLLIISTLLWESLFCFIIIPEGFCLREKNLIQHMVFSAIFASISLFQILKSLRNDPQKFFWIPWFIITLFSLLIRANTRIKREGRTVQEEIIFHMPWIIGFVIPHVIWLEPFSSMNQGTPIELPLSGYFVNSYTIIINLLIGIISLGFILGIQYEIKKEKKS